MTEPVYILGGWRSDFAVAAAAEGGLYQLVEAAALGALDASGVPADDIQVGHVANTTGELFNFQAHLGGFLASVHPAFAQLPTSRHEAACASGSVATLAAMADIESGRYDVALVVGADILRNVPGQRAGELLAAHMWSDREAVGHPFPWPCLFGEVALEYDRRYGIDHAHFETIGRKNLSNARRNPDAQTRSWEIADDWFAEDDATNPIVHGPLRKHDCGRITDGSAGMVLASAQYAEQHARRNGIPLDRLPRIKGWGHRTAPMLLTDKFKLSAEDAYVFPHLRRVLGEAIDRAGLSGPGDLDAVELHDCFTFSEYLIVDHLGLTEPGKVWQLIEDGTTQLDGALPVNPSGGLLGGGHPVGATGVRMVLDAVKQVTGVAEDYQVDDARDVLTVNIGGSYTTAVSFVVGVDR